MVREKLKYRLLFLLIVIWQLGAAQPHLTSSVKMNKSKVFVGEPVEVNVAVFTTTWFTKGVDPGNIKVDGAFTIYFRGLSVSKQINGQKYAGVQMIFNVFPYEAGTLTFPSVEINVETPDKGGYKGVRRTVRTNPKTIIVQPIPKGYSKTDWLVATNVKVEERWEGDVSNVKVGNVLERKISRTAEGTVSGLIPPITWDSIDNVSLYPDFPVAENIKTKTSISAVRTDGVKYLFEKEGKITLPKTEIRWWNATEKKLYKRTLKAITIDVQPNPNLEFLQSIRDSLAVLNDDGLNGNEEQTGFFRQLTKKQIAALLLVILVVIFLLRKTIQWYRSTKGLAAVLNERREKYLQSEEYHFKQFLKAAKGGKTTKISTALYRWIDHLELPEPTLDYFAQTFGDKVVVTEAGQILNYSSNKNSTVSVSQKNWRNSRKKYLKRSSLFSDLNNKNWINP